MMMLMAEGRKWPEISVGEKIVEERENRMIIIRNNQNMLVDDETICRYFYNT